MNFAVFVRLWRAILLVLEKKLLKDENLEREKNASYQTFSKRFLNPSTYAQKFSQPMRKHSDHPSYIFIVRSAPLKKE